MPAEQQPNTEVPRQSLSPRYLAHLATGELDATKTPQLTQPVTEVNNKVYQVFGSKWEQKRHQDVEKIKHLSHADQKKQWADVEAQRIQRMGARDEVKAVFAKLGFKPEHFTDSSALSQHLQTEFYAKYCNSKNPAEDIKRLAADLGDVGDLAKAHEFFRVLLGSDQAVTALKDVVIAQNELHITPLTPDELTKHHDFAQGEQQRLAFFREEPAQPQAPKPKEAEEPHMSAEEEALERALKEETQYISHEVSKDERVQFIAEVYTNNRFLFAHPELVQMINSERAAHGDPPQQMPATIQELQEALQQELLPLLIQHGQQNNKVETEQQYQTMIRNTFAQVEEALKRYHKQQEQFPSTLEKRQMPEGWRELENLATEKTLPTEAEVLADLQPALEIVQRQHAIETVDISKPTVVIPDLHARREMLLEILTQPSGIAESGHMLTVYQAAMSGKINIVFTGDIIHSEDPRRWKSGNEDNIDYEIDDYGDYVPDSQGKRKLTSIGERRKTIIDGFNNRPLPPGLIVRQLLSRELNPPQDPEGSPRRHSSDQLRSIYENEIHPILREKQQAAERGEMRDNLRIMQMVWRLQKATEQYGNVRIILGTHDDVSGQVYLAEKFGVNQTSTLRHWLEANGMNHVLENWGLYSRALPIMLKQKDSINGRSFRATHTIPNEGESDTGKKPLNFDLSKMEQREPSLVKRFIGDRTLDTPSSRGERDPKEVSQTMHHLVEQTENRGDKEHDVYWFNGHDPLPNGYAVFTHNGITRIILDNDENYPYAIFDPTKNPPYQPFVLSEATAPTEQPQPKENPTPLQQQFQQIGEKIKHGDIQGLRGMDRDLLLASLQTLANRIQLGQHFPLIQQLHQAETTNTKIISDDKLEGSTTQSAPDGLHVSPSIYRAYQMWNFSRQLYEHMNQTTPEHQAKAEGESAGKAMNLWGKLAEVAGEAWQHIEEAAPEAAETIAEA